KQTDQIKQKSVQITNIFNALAVSVPPTRWLTIQRRWDGSVNFHRSWEEYKNGFGNVQGEFFIGLEKLHIMTSAQPYELHIKIGKIDRSIGYANYDDFQIGGEDESYMLKTLGKYSGTAGDSLTRHKGMKFTTFDRDNDNINKINCARSEAGGWWFDKCAYSTLNGKYYSDGHCDITNGIFWGSFQNNAWNISLTFTEMMIRPKFE
ncbi:fibrinogen C domain-containing protein 1-like, partial [Drosophila ficusphila]|uniref:fibrinogen C domain-containing protein 1-like n=1 Tax=Drosophila ficusphila TaxID=30025 RepID=UPI001C8912CF